MAEKGGGMEQLWKARQEEAGIVEFDLIQDISDYGDKAFELDYYIKKGGKNKESISTRVFKLAELRGRIVIYEKLRSKKTGGDSKLGELTHLDRDFVIEHIGHDNIGRDNAEKFALPEADGVVRANIEKTDWINSSQKAIDILNSSLSTLFSAIEEFSSVASRLSVQQVHDVLEARTRFEEFLAGIESLGIARPAEIKEKLNGLDANLAVVVNRFKGAIKEMAEQFSGLTTDYLREMGATWWIPQE